jgi:hypothetical protein
MPTLKPAPPVRRGHFGPAAVAVLLVFGAVLLLGVSLGISAADKPFGKVAGAAFAALLFGVLVGLSEILSKYRDEPILAATTAYGLTYLLLNGLISFSAFAVMRRYATAVFPAVQHDLFLTAVVAGFGGMTIFRSKLFTYRSPDGKDYAIGPAIVLDTPCAPSIIKSIVGARRNVRRRWRMRFMA